MTKRTRPWVKDVKVFAGFALLNLFLTIPCGVSMTGGTRSSVGGWKADLWYWVFATPTTLARELGWGEVAAAMFWVNPLIYGLIWWGLWRAVKLFRTKPAD